LDDLFLRCHERVDSSVVRRTLAYHSLRLHSDVRQLCHFLRVLDGLAFDQGSRGRAAERTVPLAEDDIDIVNVPVVHDRDAG
jgi:hypothetical protein